MKRSPRNRNIGESFKQASQPKSESKPTQLHVKSTSPPSNLPSTPLKKYEHPARAEDSVIKASDDEDNESGYSDDSFEDLSTILGRTRPGDRAIPRPSGNRDNALATPKAKRSAVALHSSPLAIIPKHKFDLKALAKDAQRDDATLASSLRVKARTEALRDQEERPQESMPGSVVTGFVAQESTENAQKVLRAVQRAEPAGCQPRFCFFRKEYQHPPPSRVPKAPRGERSQIWELLAISDIKVREQHLVSGLPQTIISKTGYLPDTLFEWMLKDLCSQKSSIIRGEFCKIIQGRREQIERLMTKERLEEMLIVLGSDPRNMDKEAQYNIIRSEEDPYSGREWVCVVTFLELLGRTSDKMCLAAVEYTAQMLVRMALDRVVLTHIDIMAPLGDAVEKLTASIPHSSWNKFCFDTCQMIQTNVKHHCIHIDSLLCVPVSSRRTHDLRRRLAIALLLQDATLAHQYPEDVMTIRKAINRLQEPDFQIKAKTDFPNLRASIILLDIAIDDGSVVKFKDVESEQAFNREVDELATRLLGMWGSINDSGMRLSRTEAKSVVEWVQQRLSNFVRTRKKIKASVFDVSGRAEDQFLSRQQDFMKTFLKTDRHPGRDAR